MNKILITVLLLLSAGSSFGGTERLDWNDFIKTEQYAQFVSAIDKMRKNVDENDRKSWGYWSNVHQNNCPHGVEYFLAWHRGYLYHFEKILQEISGNSEFRLPYWDYYKNPELPKEFTSNTSSPLYVSRENTNVKAAISLSPFSSNIVNFNRGLSSAFESSIENRPHNPVHDIIGNSMSSMQSPRDPIFWLHHANIDRLWSAWVAAKGGRTMPSETSPYWEGKFLYATNLTIEKNKTFETVKNLGYNYDSIDMPQASRPLAPSRPHVVSSKGIKQKAVSPGLFSLGGATGVRLNESSISIALPLKKEPNNVIFKSMLMSKKQPETAQASLLLKGVQLTESGKKGGYFYKVYINLPNKPGPKNLEDDYFVGTIGPFEIQSAVHHDNDNATHNGVTPDQGIDLNLELSPNNRNLLQLDPSKVNLSFIRVDGKNTQSGDVILIKSFELLLKSNE